jgi:hypothetical protein
MVVGFSNAPEDAFETRRIEEELSTQLNLLKEEMPKSYLFPEIEEPMVELPHLKDYTAAALKVEGDTAAALELKREDVQNHVVEEMMEEGFFDSLAICALIGMLFFVPQLLQ